MYFRTIQKIKYLRKILTHFSNNHVKYNVERLARQASRIILDRVRIQASQSGRIPSTTKRWDSRPADSLEINFQMDAGDPAFRIPWIEGVRGILRFCSASCHTNLSSGNTAFYPGCSSVSVSFSPSSVTWNGSKSDLHLTKPLCSRATWLFFLDTRPSKTNCHVNIRME